MALFRHLSRNSALKTDSKYKLNNVCAACIRLLNYTPQEYETTNDPAPYFFNKEVQSLLKDLTRVDLTKVFRKRKLGDKKLADPQYKFMTNEQLDEAMAEAKNKLEYFLQMPPVLAVHKVSNKVYSKDPALQGLETARLVFTDITYGVTDLERLIIVREPDGTLKDAEWEVRNRINQVYFPKKGKEIKAPRMFEDQFLESLLKRQEYLFVLDAACAQFEPNESDYQRVTSITYQHLNDNNAFDVLRSTRHFGALTFYLVWNKSIDNLLLDLIETFHIEEANDLLKLYGIIHKVQYESDGDLKAIKQYIEKDSTKRGALELAVQAYEDIRKQREEVDKGIKTAHGLM